MDEVKIPKYNPDAKVTVKNIAGWNVGFARREGYGDVMISANGSTRLPAGEIIAQIQNGNKLFVGVDGRGSHATLFIDDKATRIEAEFESPDGEREQEIYSDKKLKELFAIKKADQFEEEFKKAIRTRAEKYAVIEAIPRLGLNAFDKIRFIEKYTGFKVI